jgi:aspartyl-tRNA(Asn)/glutamyl-tRNA(Gln) amidotransferase subunit A
MTVAALARRLREGELSPSEAVAACMEAIAGRNGALNAFLTVRADEALAEAAALEGAPERGPLWGVPLGIKDVIDVAGTPTTAASAVLDGNVPAADATAVARLRAAGAVIVGKLNTHEFAYGATTTSAYFGPTRNPWDTERLSGGSSGGSGAAVAAGLVPGALGTDTAGSIRIPAALCGVTGLRPSAGRVPNRGVVPTAWTFDTVGPLAATAEDCALLLDAIAGADARDSSTVTAFTAPAAEALEESVRGLRVGVLADRFERGIDPRVAEVVRAALGDLAAAGATLEETRLPELDHAGVAQQLMMLPEASVAHREWLRTRLADYGPDVRARLLAGLVLPSTGYATGLRARRWLAGIAAAAFERHDLLVAPAMPVVAPPLGRDTVELDGAETPFRLALIPFNSPWSFLGLPAASVPCGFVDGLPVALAIAGPRLEDGRVLRLAHAFQKVTDWHEQRPALATETTIVKGV